MVSRAAVACAVVAAAAGCGAAPRPPAAVLRVPAQFPTVQGAVDHARPGDLVLVSPGTYHEAVRITRDDIDLRGTDRNAVVLQGDDTLTNGVTASGNGDVVEDLTVAHYAINGILFTKADYAGREVAGATSPDAPLLTGYRASYVTAYDNGLYGIYAFGARAGQVDHSYASGSPDSGVYIGQCRPCDALVTDTVAEHDRIGVEAANASGGLSVVASTFTANRAGVVIESSTSERLAPQEGALVAGDRVTANDDPQTPSQDEDTDVFGYGIVIGGGSGDVVERNRVTGNPTVGILVTPAAGRSPSRDTVRGNTATGNGVDLAFGPSAGGTLAVAGTCFAGNDATTTLPVGIEAALPCGPPPAATVAVMGLPASPGPPGVDYTKLAAPPAQPGMPGAATAPAQAATGLGGPPGPQQVPGP